MDDYLRIIYEVFSDVMTVNQPKNEHIPAKTGLKRPLKFNVNRYYGIYLSIHFVPRLTCRWPIQNA